MTRAQTLPDSSNDIDQRRSFRVLCRLAQKEKHADVSVGKPREYIGRFTSQDPLGFRIKLTTHHVKLSEKESQELAVIAKEHADQPTQPVPTLNHTVNVLEFGAIGIDVENDGDTAKVQFENQPFMRIAFKKLPSVEDQQPDHAILEFMLARMTRSSPITMYCRLCSVRCISAYRANAILNFDDVSSGPRINWSQVNVGLYSWFMSCDGSTGDLTMKQPNEANAHVKAAQHMNALWDMMGAHTFAAKVVDTDGRRPAARGKFTVNKLGSFKAASEEKVKTLSKEDRDAFDKFSAAYAKLNDSFDRVYLESTRAYMKKDAKSSASKLRNRANAARGHGSNAARGHYANDEDSDPDSDDMDGINSNVAKSLEALADDVKRQEALLSLQQKEDPVEQQRRRTEELAVEVARERQLVHDAKARLKEAKAIEEKKDGMIKALATELQQERSKAERALQDKNEKTVLVDSLKQQVKEHAAEVLKLKKEVAEKDAVKEQLLKAKQNVAILQKKKEELEKLQSQQVADIERREESLRRAREQMTKQNDLSKQGNPGLVERVQEVAKQQQEAAKQQQEAAKQEIRVLSDQVATLETEKVVAEKRAKALTITNGYLVNKNNELLIKLQSFERATNELAEKQLGTEEFRTKLTGYATNLEAALQAQKARVADLEGSIESQRRNLGKELEKRQQELDARRQQLEAVEQQVRNTKGNANVSKQEVRKLTLELQSVRVQQKACATLSTELRYLQPA